MVRGENMNILRLSLFNLKKNKKEAVAIVFLAMITTLMLAVFASNISKANKAFDDSFAQAGSKDTCVMIEKDKKHFSLLDKVVNIL